MFSQITAALQKAVAAFERDDIQGYAFHVGKAGGVATAIGAYGIRSLSMCDDISDAYETGDSGLIAAILAEVTERLDNPDAGARIMDSRAIGWPEYGAALNQAVEAKAEGNRLRYALMTGFVAGLLFNNPGPGHPEHGTILEAVVAAYETDSDDSLQYAQGRIGAGVRMTDPTPFMSDEQYAQHREERLRMMRWLQNFGLRRARAADQGVAVPDSMTVNDAARRLAREPEDAAAYINRGHEKRNSGDYDGAIAEFDRAIELDPDDAGAYHGRGEAKRGKGDYDGAIADCDRAIELDPNDPGGCNIRGMSKWQKGDHDGAIADFDRAIELDPDHAGAYFIRGMIKEEKGDYHSAIPDFDRAIELDQDDVGQYDHRGFAKISTGDYEGAIADFGRALELDPGDEYAQQMLDTARSEAGFSPRNGVD